MKQATTWKVSGRYFEACNCEVICPCRNQGGMTVGVCDFVLSWRIVNGAFADIDMSDRFVVMAGSYRANEPDKPWHVILYVDERSSGEQFAALSDIFRGRAGGTVFQHFAASIGEIDAVRRAAIELDHSPPRWFKRASSWVEVRATRDMSSELPVQGHDHSGNQLIADALCVHDEHLDFQPREQCGFETDFEYIS